jgi:asparagine synthase (glutamine-hydrolysing)
LWAGYESHRIQRIENHARRALGRGAEVIGTLAHALPRSVRAARGLRRLALAPDDSAARKRLGAMFDEHAKLRLYTSDFRASLRGSDPLEPLRAAYRACRSLEPLDRSLYLDVKTYLVDDILTKVDRMSMAVSLETREPLLDHRLLEFAARVPVSLKLRAGRSKYLLRRLLERKVPSSIVERGKRGFEAPIGEWLRGPLASITAELLTDGRLASRGLFEQREVTRLWTEHQAHAADHRHRLWQLVMLELWFRQFVDVSPARHADTMLSAREVA